MKEFIEFIVKHLVDDPAKVHIGEFTDDKNTIEIKIEVAKSDIGKVVGKHGKNINAIRTLFTAIGAKNNRRTFIQVVQ